jgi:hypothetical protein
MFNRLIFDGEMINFLDVVPGRISQILVHGMSGVIKEEGNFIKRVEDKIDVVSYLPKAKYLAIQNDATKDPFGANVGRVNIKVGRFIRKFLKPTAFDEFDIKDSDIEKFVNTWKSYFSFDQKNLKIVEGEDIKKYYLEDNYFRPGGFKHGSLWNSCMRQSDRNKFMSLYSKNPEKVKMLVLLSDCGLVRARALLWQDIKDFSNPDDSIKFMDRIYTVYDHDVNSFKKWAKQNGYLTKWDQSAKNELYVDIDDNPIRKHLYVILDKHQLRYYPYLDTFKFYDTELGRFSNSQNWSYDYTLVQSSGRVERSEEVEDDWGGGVDEF